MTISEMCVGDRDSKWPCSMPMGDRNCNKCRHLLHGWSARVEFGIQISLIRSNMVAVCDCAIWSEISVTVSGQSAVICFKKNGLCTVECVKWPKSRSSAAEGVL